MKSVRSFNNNYPVNWAPKAAKSSILLHIKPSEFVHLLSETHLIFHMAEADLEFLQSPPQLEVFLPTMLTSFGSS
jgi:hypothetical protein